MSESVVSVCGLHVTSIARPRGPFLQLDTDREWAILDPPAVLELVHALGRWLVANHEEQSDTFGAVVAFERKVIGAALKASLEQVDVRLCGEGDLWTIAEALEKGERP